MKRPITLLVLLMFVTSTILPGCSSKPYEANMDFRKQDSFNKNQAKSKALGTVMKVMNTIIGSVEEEATRQLKERASQRHSYATGHVPNSDSQFAMAIMGDTLGSMVEWQGKAEIARTRVEAIRYLQPIIEAIYADTSEKIGTPATPNDVSLAFMKNLPFLATVAGMYGLGVAGIKAAGDNISNALNGDNNSHAINKNSGNTAADSGSNTGSQNSGNTTTDILPIE